MSLHDRGAPAPIRRAVLPTPRFVLLFAISAPIALLIVSLRPEAWRFALLYPVAALALFAADLTMTLPQNRLRVCARSGPADSGKAEGVRRRRDACP